MDSTDKEWCLVESTNLGIELRRRWEPGSSSTADDYKLIESLLHQAMQWRAERDMEIAMEYEHDWDMDLSHPQGELIANAIKADMEGKCPG